MASYYDVLRNSVAELSSDLDKRLAIYDRASQALVQRLRAADPPLPEAVIEAERAALEAAIQRIEAEVADAADVSVSPISQPEIQSRSGGRPAWVLLGVVGIGIALMLGAAGGYYAYRAKVAKGPELATRSTGPRAIELDDRQIAATGDADTPIPYVFLRQLIYYRTTHPPGTVIIDKAQRYLYLVRPNVVAVRYGMGVGRECLELNGLLRVSRKDGQPVWRSASAGGVQSGIGSSSNPLGARALYLDNDNHLIHGTALTRSIGRSVWLGCFRLINDDVVELYDRLAVGSRVVVMN